MVLRAGKGVLGKLSDRGSATDLEAHNLLTELEDIELGIPHAFQYQYSGDSRDIVRKESPLSCLSEEDFELVYAAGRQLVYSGGDEIISSSRVPSGIYILVQGAVFSARQLPNVYSPEESSPLLGTSLDGIVDDDLEMVSYSRGSPLGALSLLTGNRPQSDFLVASSSAVIFYVDNSVLQSLESRGNRALNIKLYQWCALQVVRRLAPRFSDLDMNEYGVVSTDRSKMMSPDDGAEDPEEAADNTVQDPDNVEEVAYKEARNFVAFLLRGIREAEVVHLQPRQNLERSPLSGVLIHGTLRGAYRNSLINAPAIFSSVQRTLRAGPQGATAALCGDAGK
eukprot:CAMPEP_0184686998 /NCGR_PEP_ID=MMETSP0312-20130426/24809_1 /TAXON_ID=31354 /ORGANISM="Compsopogon coeruleus, Strain SAG 36.94" /LENGTH=337 /DNA_ID=CAMNT_0027142659 /DNA_START=21 /DNA_END=1034 /DNA_ORIENTATION=-